MRKLFLILFCLITLNVFADDRVIIIYRDDGVSVVSPAWRAKKQETDEEFLERIAKDFICKESCSEDWKDKYEVIDKKDLPDREFRNAWEGKKGEGIKVNPEKKQKILDKKNK